MINDVERKPEAVFLRHDVFTGMADKRPAPSFRALAWYTTISGWVIAHPEVRMFNRASALDMTNKLHVLYWRESSAWRYRSRQSPTITRCSRRSCRSGR